MSFKYYLEIQNNLLLKRFLFWAFLCLVKSSFAQVHNCYNWLHTPSKTSAFRVGNLNIPGDQMTIEATIFQTANNPVFNTGDIVSKHTDPSDCNYLLRPGDGSITTSNGFFKTPTVCGIENNKVYHIAMVYDGATLKFYRNGFLLSQIAATGNLVQNGIITRIGYYAYEYWDTQFFGYINDVRIWNVARTQSEIRTYMNTTLPNPTTQPGLLAYYTFENLINKQGNTTFDGVINGSATINQVLPNCDFIVDSCSIQITPADSLIVNHYASVISYSPCDNELQIDNASNFQPGDTVVLMQMKGAVIDSSNSSAFGTITQYNNAGNYEFNIVKSKAGNTLTLLNVLKRNYDIPNGKVQLIRVPYFDHFDSSKVVTCLPWDGSKGGVLILNVKNDINLKADIDVSGKGFRHGGRLQDSRVTANATGYFYNAASNNGGEKGEGVYESDILRKYGRGAQANGGGGGNAHNAGGGGGGNGGAGGTGGDQYEPLKTIMDQNGGKGGKELLTNPVVNKLFLGGAGGMGQANDLEEFSAGNGGGIAIMIANQLNSNGFQIKANGQDGEQAPNPTLCKDGMPGGGAGGTILLDIPNITTATSIAAKGGNGADQIAVAYNGRFGGGGGGGGGVVATTQGVLSPLFSVDVSGGINGVCVAYGNDAWGATPGNGGKIIPVFPLMKADQQFIRNIDSVRMTTQLQNCNEMTVSGIPYVQNFPVATWLWDFGDGNSSNVQNPIHTYSNEGSYNIKLIISDMNGCRDSISTQVIAYSTQISLSNDTSICEKNTVQFTASGGNTYQWTPAATLNDPNIANPVATPLATTKYFVKVTKAAGCEITDSVLVTVNNLPNIIKSPDTTICIGTSASLLVSGGAQYTWSPAATLNNPGISNPMASPIQATNYKVLVTSSEGCTQEDSIKVDLFPEQKIQAVADPLVCMHTSVNLSATGGNSYVWSPQNMVVDPASGNTTSVPLSASTLFYLTIKDVNSCTYQDSVEIKVKPEKVFSISADTTVCMNSNVVVAASGGDQYQWLLPAGISDPGNASVNWPATGNTTFSVVVSENECGQMDTLFTTVSTLPLPQVTAQNSNDISCAVPFAKLSAVGNGSTFEWSPATGLSDPHINNPVATPKTNTVYIVTVTDGNGCRNTDSVLINVKFTDKVFAGMPNAFTPNGDGINDCFGLRPFGQVKNLDFRIYNRFGQLVFQANNSNDCWNGTFKGVPQDAGVFVFTVTGSTECQQINYKGTVTLIR